MAIELPRRLAFPEKVRFSSGFFDPPNRQVLGNLNEAVVLRIPRPFDFMLCAASCFPDKAVHKMSKALVEQVVLTNVRWPMIVS